MKVKRLYEDFQVEEITKFPVTGGGFRFYRLEKRGLGTPEAVDLILKTWNLGRNALSYGGLKDRHALTTQYLTIKHGPDRALKKPGIDLIPLGQAPRAYHARDIVANRFRITIRSLSPEEAERGYETWPILTRFGTPNFFDDQRFGSLGRSREFVARPWCQGDYERAIWLALADDNEHDRPMERDQKQILKEHWGDWSKCKAMLDRSHRRSIVTFLNDRPGDFRGAIARIRADLRGLYLSAFQSAIWNEALNAYIQERIPEQRRTLLTKTKWAWNALEEAERAEISSFALPLPAARTRLPEGELGALLERVTNSFGLTWRELRIKYPRDSFFSKGERKIALFPEGETPRIGEDELARGRKTLALEFQLPRGAYATIIIKRLHLSPD